jgi:hypothetical protein
VPVRSGSSFGVESFVAFLAQETIHHTRGTTKIRVPKSIKEKYFFLEGLATPPASPEHLSPKKTESAPDQTYSNRSKTFWGKKEHGESGVFGGLQKNGGLLLFCFHFAFTRTDSKRNTRTQRDRFYA